MSEISTVVEPEIIEAGESTVAHDLETLELLKSRSLILASLGDDEDDEDDEDWDEDDDDDFDDEDFDDDEDDEDLDDDED